MTTEQLANWLIAFSQDEVDYDEKCIVRSAHRLQLLEAENKFFKDLMGDVEILRKAQEK